ncbi:5098_t:CDS:2 [Dentiscutata erythropus]|uniref:5098_t:CDS:1 n=1 Tax=Dentiscutata erythropus TaxID=1348616 RepID=A0A9N9B344_9GLOM|nr:5098_t:CDS:2 [Dentiscutata erythropus]
MLKNKYAPVTKNSESIENWITLIYRLLLESFGASDNTSTSSDDEASIPSAGNRKQWQYAHHNMCSQDRGRADNDPNTVKSFPSTSCQELLEKMHATIYLSLDELWSIPNKVGLKALLLDPRLKLLPFANAN